MIGAIVQVRMNSTRLPGKVMMKVLGKPLLELLVERLKYCNYLDDIVIATTTNPADDVIQELAEKIQVKYIRGSEEDVLGRFYQAAVEFHLDHIVRITADCPLIDPEIVDSIIKEYVNSGYKYDYVSNTLKPTFPDGLDAEVFSFKVLKMIHEIADKKYQREHVCTYLVENPDKFKLKNIANDRDCSRFRWTVDNPEDFELVKAVFENIYPSRKKFFMKDILGFIDQNPDISSLNSNIARNEGFIESLKKEGFSDAEKNRIIETVIKKKHVNGI